ncbi:hypothetical protein YTPLAS18_03790 [Nitrospira sp.]|nr:hypothetical protein YTPLAS18_03790 [Nitrospira sp.]
MPQPTVTAWIRRRQHDRFTSRFPIHYRHVANIGKGVITNLSLNGWTVACPAHTLRPGDELVFRLPIEDPDNPSCDTRAIVRWVHQAAFGVEVLDQSPLSRARLKTWVGIISNALSWSRLSVRV